MSKRAARWYYVFSSTVTFVVIAAIASTFVITGLRILTSGSKCQSVRFDMLARTVIFRCLPDSSGDMSSTAAGALALVPGLAMLTAAMVPLWQRWQYRRALRRRVPVEPGPLIPMARAVLPERVEPMMVTPPTLAPPPDEWSGLRATHPNAFGPVMHAAESIPKEQWPAEATRAVGRACVLFTTGGLDANRAVQRAFEEATSGATTDSVAPDRGDDGSGVRLPPRLPPR
jgi:hypothetical protein